MPRDTLLMDAHLFSRAVAGVHGVHVFVWGARVVLVVCVCVCVCVCVVQGGLHDWAWHSDCVLQVRCGLRPQADMDAARRLVPCLRPSERSCKDGKCNLANKLSNYFVHVLPLLHRVFGVDPQCVGIRVAQKMHSHALSVQCPGARGVAVRLLVPGCGSAVAE